MGGCASQQVAVEQDGPFSPVAPSAHVSEQGRQSASVADYEQLMQLKRDAAAAESTGPPDSGLVHGGGEQLRLVSLPVGHKSAIMHGWDGDVIRAW